MDHGRVVILTEKLNHHICFNIFGLQVDYLLFIFL